MILATLCYVKKNGKTLMIHRNKKQNDVHAGKWNGLGGKVEPGETPEECVIREIFEESGLRIRNPRLSGLITFPKFAHGEDWYAYVFIAREFSGELIDSPEGQLAWVEDNKLMDLPFWEGDYIFLPWLEDNRFFSAKFSYRDGQLIDHSVVFYPCD
jgi:8-oxo-dGTP diphosphatase